MPQRRKARADKYIRINVMRAVSCHYTFIVEVLLTLQTAYKAQMSALIEMERFIKHYLLIFSRCECSMYIQNLA